MIRLFAAFRKIEKKKISDLDFFRRAVGAFRPGEAVCPSCGAKGRLKRHGAYTRDLIVHGSGGVTRHIIRVPRFYCLSCKRTHAMLPDILIPFSSFSLFFVLAVCQDYFQGRDTVSQILERYQISIATLYAWKKRLLRHKRLILGALTDAVTPAPTFLAGLFPRDATPSLLSGLSGFHANFGFSFLQNQPNTS
jgi:transposase-like protein